MKYKNKIKTIQLKGNDSFEGISLEREMEIATETKKLPEKNINTIFYTQRKAGVLPECDIRTDRWDVAQNAQNAIALNTHKKINEKLEQSQTIDDNNPNKTAEP